MTVSLKLSGPGRSCKAMAENVSNTLRSLSDFKASIQLCQSSNTSIESLGLNTKARHRVASRSKPNSTKSEPSSSISSLKRLSTSSESVVSSLAKLGACVVSFVSNTS
eukprot:1740482-Rhodomonas_salina.1